MTSEHSQQNLFNLTQYAEDFLAKTSVRQGRAKASQKNPDQVFFTNSSESYAWYDPDTSSWKTWQLSLITDWTSFSESFPKQGTMQNGQLFLQVHWEPVTEEVVGGSLPTPTTEAAHHRNNVPPSIGKTRGYDLTMKICEEQQKAEMLPTPTTMDHLGQRSPEALKKQMEGARKGRTSLSNLREAVNPETQEMFNSLLPTPRASDMEGGTIKDAKFKNGSFYRENKKGEKFGIKLRDAISILPTPRAAIGMGMKMSKGMANLEHKKYLETEIAADLHKSGKVQNIDSTPTGDNMYLNPAFCEEMMGYPIGWTVSEH